MDHRRYHTLDGMRGVAALTVLVGHAILWFSPLPMPRMWLAVDLFFVLSGFVLAKVYEPRFRSGLSAGQFMLQRYIRLWPLLMIGVGIGALSAAISLLMGRSEMTTGETLAALATGLLILPSPTPHIKDIFPLNPPGWSLFFELAANLVYAGLWRRMTNLAVAALAGVSGLFLVYYYMQGGGFGGSVWNNFVWGFPRVGFSFFVGVLLGRFQHKASIVTPLAWIAPLLIFPLLFIPIPVFSAEADLMLVLIGFPLLVWIGASIEPRNTRPFAELGVISYPLYAVHAALLLLLWKVAHVAGISPEAFAPWSGLIFAGLLVPACLLLDRFYDEPVRRWLTRRFTRRPARTEQLIDAATPL